MSDETPCDWTYDPRTLLCVTGTPEDGAAVGHSSLDLHYARVVHGGRVGEYTGYGCREDAMRAAESVLANLRTQAVVPEKVVGAVSKGNPW